MTASTRTIRQPAVAGTFYPAAAQELAACVDELLVSASPVATAPAETPAAVIAPHAGYRYSGPTAAVAFGGLPGAGSGSIGSGSATSEVERVVLVGPSHYVAFQGAATSPAESFATPLGEVAVARDAVQAIERLPDVACRPEAHEREHSLEVELPFLQRRLGAFECVPIVVGEVSADAVAEVIERAMEGAASLVVVSSDLSHYLPYAAACHRDAATAERIAGGDDTLTPDDACGARAINGLLRLAAQRGWLAETVDLCNSGDRGGPAERVVGYGAFRLRAEA